MKMKKAPIITICVLLLIPVLLYGFVVLKNNAIAKALEQALQTTPLPEDAILLDSVSIAGKLVGNGNGMQYMGSILIATDMSEEELTSVIQKEITALNKKLPSFKQVRNIELRQNEFEKTTSRKIKRFLVK
jgi:hypothetical protein